LQILPDEERLRMLGEEELSKATPSPESVIATSQSEEAINKLRDDLVRAGYKEDTSASIT
jgi:hypothetical protein